MMNDSLINKNKNDDIISGKSLILLESLLKFYSENYNLFNYIITNKNNISLRVLDWLVTNYAKKFNIILKNTHNNRTINFNVYLEYKNQLKAYSKKMFDPFCRRERILINLKTFEWEIYNNSKIDENDQIISTVGQLNFFKWFIENNIYKYAIENIYKIDKDMSDTLATNIHKTKNKRSELSKSASKLICKYSCDTIIDFT